MMNLAMFNSSVQIINVKKNNSGPRTEPWGTPREIDKCLGLYPLIETYCFLSFK